MKLLSILSLAALLSGCGFEVVDTGHRGLYVTFGKVTGEPLAEGLYFYNPLTTSVHEIDVREKKLEGKTTAFTKDTQNATLHYSLTFYPKKDAIGDLYQNFGGEWENIIIPQIVLSAIQNEVGQIVADDLSSKRETIEKAAEKIIQASLLTRNVIITKLNLTNVDFDDAYEKAVEQKVVAIQEAMEAKNKTVRIKEQAAQTVATAEAEATAMKIKSAALAQNKGLVQFEAVQKWDGHLPQLMMGNGSTPMLDMRSLMKTSAKDD